MNDSDPSSSSSDKPPSRSDVGGDSGREPAGDERSGDSWLERLKAVIGLRSPASLRQDLEQVLAREELTGETFSPEERVMLRNILRLRDVRVEDVMIPRADIDAVEIGVSLGELVQTFRASGHSRMPVYRGTLDEPVGMVHIKDLMGFIAERASIERAPSDGEPPTTDSDLKRVDLSTALADVDLVRSVLFVPPSMPAAALLANMQTSRMQLALVIDEYGGTDGIVSLEDIVETVVGDIEDEHDENEGPMIVTEGDGSYLIDARADLDEVAEALGNGFSEVSDLEDVDTIGGLVFTLLGRIPVRGELVEVNGRYELEILDADPRRIRRLRLRHRAVPMSTQPEQQPSTASTGTDGA